MDGRNLECVSRDGEERRILNQADGFRKIFDANDEIRNFFNQKNEEPTKDDKKLRRNKKERSRKSVSPVKESILRLNRRTFQSDEILRMIKGRARSKSPPITVENLEANDSVIAPENHADQFFTNEETGVNQYKPKVFSKT